MEATPGRSRCGGCGGRLGFDDWSKGAGLCARCGAEEARLGPAATFVRGPAAPEAGPRPRAVPAGLERPGQAGARADQLAQYERLLDELPDNLIDEIVAALEEEERRRQSVRPGLPARAAAAAVPAPAVPPAPAAPASPIAEAIEEMGLASGQRELQIAAWGFAAGFGANVIIAKYAQMQTGAPLSEFVAPLLLGGLAAGAACAAIAWGVAKLREH